MHWLDISDEMKKHIRGTKIVYRYLNGENGVERVNWRKAKRLHKKFDAMIVDDYWLK